jgi:hypothetical protein
VIIHQQHASLGDDRSDGVSLQSGPAWAQTMAPRPARLRCRSSAP